MKVPVAFWAEDRAHLVDSLLNLLYGLEPFVKYPSENIVSVISELFGFTYVCFAFRVTLEVILLCGLYRTYRFPFFFGEIVFHFAMILTPAVLPEIRYTYNYINTFIGHESESKSHIYFITKTVSCNLRRVKNANRKFIRKKQIK